MHWLWPGSEKDGKETVPPQACSEFPTALLYGASVYTTFRWPIADRWLNAHLERLTADAETLGMTLSLDASALVEWMTGLIPPDEPVVRLTAFPRAEGYGDFYASENLGAVLLLSTRALPAPPGRKLLLKSTCYERPKPQVKLGSLGEAILLKREARRQGYDDVLFVNGEGCFSEASTANVFWIDEKGLQTPEPLQDGCLPGITRLRVLEAAGRLGILVKIAAEVGPGNLRMVAGAFLTNSVSGLSPIAQIDDVELPWTPAALEMAVQLSAAVREG